LVGVDSEEINVTNGTARKVLCKRNTELDVIGVRVSNWDDTVNVVGDVSLHVTDNGLEVTGNDVLGTWVVDNLVTSKESEGVVVSREDLDDLEDVLEVSLVVSGPWLQIVQVLIKQRAVDVEHEVDASGGQHGHALVMVDCWVDGVDTDSVDSQLLEKVDITGALLWVRERISSSLEARRSTWLVINTLDEEWFTSGLAVKVTTLDLNEIDGRHE